MKHCKDGETRVHNRTLFLSNRLLLRAVCLLHIMILTTWEDGAFSWFLSKHWGFSLANHVLSGYSDRRERKRGAEWIINQWQTGTPGAQGVKEAVVFVTLTLISLYIRSELELRMKYRSWKCPEVSPSPRMLRSSLNFIIPCLDASALLAGGQKHQKGMSLRGELETCGLL